MKRSGRSQKTEQTEGNPGKLYLNTVYSLARSARAWRWVALVMGLLVLVMVYQSLKTTHEMPVRLIPYDYAINKHVSHVQQQRGDAQYLSLMAAADVSLISNWTPNTIGTQYRRFLSRCSPELYSQQQVELLRDAKKQSHGIHSQAFFQRKVAIVDGHIVKVTGRLKRWGGQELLSTEQVTYRVNYRYLHGVPYIHAFNREKTKR